MNNTQESRFEYAQIILGKVSFNRFILAKEFFKHIRDLNINQKIQLKKWIKHRFKLEFKDLFLIAYLKHDAMPARSHHANVA